MNTSSILTDAVRMDILLCICIAASAAFVLLEYEATERRERVMADAMHYSWYLTPILVLMLAPEISRVTFGFAGISGLLSTAVLAVFIFSVGPAMLTNYACRMWLYREMIEPLPRS